MPQQTLLRLACLAVAALLQGCGATLLRTACDNPRVSNFGAPSSYIVMLPYRYGGSSAVNRESAAQLNQITRLHALQSAVDAPATQVTLVEGDPDQPADPACGIENVYDRVVENRSGLFWRRLFHSAIFVWGEIFDRDDGILVQSHLRVFWNGAASRELEVLVDVPQQARPLRFSGSLPSDTISFPARKIGRQEQAQLAQAIASGLHLRREPRLDAEVVPLPAKFSAVAWRRPWLQLQDRELRSVWMLIDDTGLQAGPVLPETVFARAMASYLNFRVDGDRTSREQAVAALARFRASVARPDDPLMRVPLAMTAVIEGTLGLGGSAAAAATSDRDLLPTQTADDPAAGRAQMQAALAEAARRLPGNGEVLNLAAIARIPGCCGGADAPQRIQEIQRMLERAWALEQGNARIGRNMLQWYRFLATLPPERLPFDRATLAARTQQARDAVDAWAAMGSP
jgi:hypothetical protein